MDPTDLTGGGVRLEEADFVRPVGGGHGERAEEIIRHYDSAHGDCVRAESTRAAQREDGLAVKLLEGPEQRVEVDVVGRGVDSAAIRTDVGAEVAVDEDHPLLGAVQEGQICHSAAKGVGQLKVVSLSMVTPLPPMIA